MICVRKVKILNYTPYETGAIIQMTDRLARHLIKENKVAAEGWDPSEPTPESPLMEMNPVHRQMETGPKMRSAPHKLRGTATVIKAE